MAMCFLGASWPNFLTRFPHQPRRYAIADKAAAIVEGHCTCSLEPEHAAGNPEHHRKFCIGEIRRPDVERQAVLARTDHFWNPIGDTWRKCDLRRLPPEPQRITHVIPRSNRLRRAQSGPRQTEARRSPCD